MFVKGENRDTTVYRVTVVCLVIGQQKQTVLHMQRFDVHSMRKFFLAQFAQCCDRRD